jgi:hypothetical protein
VGLELETIKAVPALEELEVTQYLTQTHPTAVVAVETMKWLQQRAVQVVVVEIKTHQII